MQRPVLYWATPKHERIIYFLGNPVVWWGTSVALLLVVGVESLRKYRRAGPLSKHPLWIPIVGFLIAYLPNAFIQRPLFLYHYLPPLLFATATAFLWLDRVEWTKVRGGLLAQRKSYWALLGVLVLGFISTLPFTCGTELGIGWRIITYPYLFFLR